MATRVVRNGNWANKRILQNIVVPAGGYKEGYFYNLTVGSNTLLIVATKTQDENDVQNVVIENLVKVPKSAVAIPAGTPLEWDSGSNCFQAVSAGDQVGYAHEPAGASDDYVWMVLGATVLAN